ncbi:YihY/virulence factor BrkB family protein [Salarchaeum sp. JOR-1]|uniref:YihY/virulence factor BrkB family protein n=1 Tax=Salarchaeum sp. JOR-1 TaxID=2599399 RepID=UPI0011985515|nr:YihY/virulence factor BrkB family protein [Salarchaeum sp. JOR-1]QDX40418.1 YihY/virulence factor BrkB family protein [Salarchaeum sp. JOR-1]
MSRNAVSVAREVVAEAQDSQITFLAAAVAYYAFVSLIPLLLLTLAAASYLGVESIGEQIVQLVGTLLTAEGSDAVRNALRGASGRGTATVVSLVVLAWSGLKLFRGLDVAFAHVYGVVGARPLTHQLRDGVLVLGAIAAGVVAAVVAGFVAGFVATGPFVGVVAFGLLAVTLCLVFFPIFYIFPDADITPREAVPGTLLAAAGWTALSGIFEAYAPLAGKYQAYGILGAALLLVTILYVGGTIIMVGAVLNAVLAGRTDETDVHDEVDEPDSAPDIAEMEREVRALRAELDAKTVSKNDLESDLRTYVRKRLRRNHARGWGPYLVLLYGTLMTLGAFYFLSGGWAILAMVVVWLSTLGLYALMLLFGVGLNAAGVPGRIADWVNDRR